VESRTFGHEANSIGVELEGAGVQRLPIAQLSHSDSLRWMTAFSNAPGVLTPQLHNHKTVLMRTLQMAETWRLDFIVDGSV
jgi:hypothetical protein